MHVTFYIFARRDDATLASSTFCLRQQKDDLKVVLEERDLEVIGAPIIKYGDSTVIVQHSESGLWLSYKVCIRIVRRLNWVVIDVVESKVFTFQVTRFVT
jgi:hypothetical protein